MNAVLYNILLIEESWKKSITGSKNIKQHSILKRFLKDRVTLETGVTADENLALPLHE